MSVICVNEYEEIVEGDVSPYIQYTYLEKLK